MADKKDAPEKPKPGELDKTPDPYADLNEVQLRSSLKAKDIEIERLKKMHAEKLTAVGTDLEAYKTKAEENESTAREQLKTIQQQSETLNNREEIVNQLTAEIAVLQDAAQRADMGGAPGALTDRQVNIDDVGAMVLVELIDGIEAYGVRMARTAPNDVVAGSAVHMIQFADMTRRFETWPTFVQWLKTGS